MSSATIITGEFRQKSVGILYGLVKDASGTPLTRADITGVVYTAFNNTAGSSPVALGGYENAPLDVSQVIFDTPLEIPDGNGATYNFRHIVSSAVTAGNFPLRLEYKFALASGDQFILAATATVVPSYSS